MNAKQIKNAVKRYRNIFEKYNIDKIQHPDDVPMISTKAACEHAHWMLDRINAFLQEKECKQKNFLEAMRWLCWVQCQIFNARLGATIDDFKADNRSEKTA